MLKKCLFLLILLIPTILSAQEDIRQRFDALFGEHEIYETFFYEIKETVLNGDSHKLSIMNSYPLNVFTKKGEITVNNKDEFIKHYDTIVTPNIVNAVRDQSFENLLSNYQGIMIGDGQIWFSGICVGKIPSNECDNVEVKILTYCDSSSVE